MATITSLPVAATIDATADTFPIVTNSLNTTQQINRNTFLNLASQPVGLTDTQVLTNKTLTSPTINGATLSGTLAGTYTIGGTPTFPSSVTQNTVSQTLTNKTLTSPTINSPTITNATISSDAITGYTTSNSGTIYGIPITTGFMPATYLTANSITSSQIANNAVTTAKLAPSKTTDANSWTKYDYGTWQEYRKRVTFSQSLSSGSVLTLSSSSLPVALSNIGTNFLIYSYTATSGAYNCNIVFEGSTASTTISFTASSLSGTAVYTGFIDLILTTP